MLARLPNLIEPLLLADRNVSLDGELPLASFDRVADLLTESVGTVKVRLVFRRNGNQAVVDGQLSAFLQLKCQRCLDSIDWSVDSDIKLGVVSSLSQINKLPGGYEPLLLRDEEKIPLKNIIEDELLLSLPDYPKHHSDCGSLKTLVEKPEPTLNTAQAIAESPFSVLADLKNLKKMETSNGSTKK